MTVTSALVGLGILAIVVIVIVAGVLAINVWESKQGKKDSRA